MGPVVSISSVSRGPYMVSCNLEIKNVNTYPCEVEFFLFSYY